MTLFQRAAKLPLTARSPPSSRVVVALISLAPPTAAPADARPRVAGLTGLGSCGHLRSYLVKAPRAYGRPATGAGCRLSASRARRRPPTAPTATRRSRRARARRPTTRRPASTSPTSSRPRATTIFTVDGATLRAVDTAARHAGPRRSARSPRRRRQSDDASVGNYQLMLAGDRLLGDRLELRLRDARSRATLAADGVVAPDIAYPGAAADVDRRDRHLRPGGDVGPADREGRRLVRQRAHDRLDRAPRQLELPDRADPGRGRGQAAAAAGDRPRPDHAQDSPRAPRHAARRSATRPASPAPGCSR